MKEREKEREEEEGNKREIERERRGGRDFQVLKFKNWKLRFLNLVPM